MIIFRVAALRVGPITGGRGRVYFVRYTCIRTRDLNATRAIVVRFRHLFYTARMR